MKPMTRAEMEHIDRLWRAKTPWKVIGERVQRSHLSARKMHLQWRQGRLKLVREEREARAQKALDLRVEGARNCEVAAALGVSQAWACNMLARRGYDTETIAEEREMRAMD